MLDRNVLNCSLRYSTNVDRISKLEFAPLQINIYTVASQVDSNTSTLLLQLLQCRDGSLTLSNNNFSNADISAVIDILCTCWQCLQMCGCLMQLYYCFSRALFLIFVCNFISPYSIMLSSYKALVADNIVYVIVYFLTLLYLEYE